MRQHKCTTADFHKAVCLGTTLLFDFLVWHTTAWNGVQRHHHDSERRLFDDHECCRAVWEQPWVPRSHFVTSETKTAAPNLDRRQILNLPNGFQMGQYLSIVRSHVYPLQISTRFYKSLREEWDVLLTLSNKMSLLFARTPRWKWLKKQWALPRVIAGGECHNKARSWKCSFLCLPLTFMNWKKYTEIAKKEQDQLIVNECQFPVDHLGWEYTNAVMARQWKQAQMSTSYEDQQKTSACSVTRSGFPPPINMPKSYCCQQWYHVCMLVAELSLLVTQEMIKTQNSCCDADYFVAIEKAAKWKWSRYLWLTPPPWMPPPASRQPSI